MRTFVAVAILAGLAARPVLAQTAPAPADPGREICSNFLSQNGVGVSGDAAELCTCLSRETTRQLTRDEMVAYSAAGSKGQPPPVSVMQKVMGIAVQCLTEAQK